MTTVDRTRAGRPGFGAALASEWRKFRAVPTHAAVLACVVAVTVGLSGLIVAFGVGTEIARAQRDGQYSVIFFGATLGVWAYTFLGARFTAAEFRTGLADLTFVATPRRSRVLLAKLVVLVGVALVAGLVVSLATVAITQGVLAAQGLPTLRLDDPALCRSIVLFVAVGMAVHGVLGALVAVLVRNPAGALVIVVLLDAVPVLVAQYLGTAYAQTVPRWVPGAVVESLAGVSTPGSAGWLPLPLALLGVLGWALVVGIPAVVRLHRSDAR